MSKWGHKIDFLGGDKMLKALFKKCEKKQEPKPAWPTIKGTVKPAPA